ncbi:circadian clock KaiB family protein [Legionella hackeliae]|uniref:Circadian clock protein kaiB n=1 Tax=Legionella hackeliae TaxID=449 RepID=A0A0A8US64_LEGHA
MTLVQEKRQVTLYIHSKSPLSIGAVKVVRKISREKSFKAKYRLAVIEIDKKIELAEKNKILATPALIIETNNIEKRIIGNLSDLASIYRELSITGE